MASLPYFPHILKTACAVKDSEVTTTDFRCLAAHRVLDKIDDGFNTVVYRVLVEKNAIKYISFLDTGWPPLKDPSTVVLPPLPTGDWNMARMSKCPETGKFIITNTELVSLPSINTIWHPTKVDYFDLTAIDSDDVSAVDRLRRVTHPMFERPVLMKIAGIPNHTQRMEAETKVYQRIDGMGIGPKFLGHVTESGRVVGFLTEWIEGATDMKPQYAEACSDALLGLHRLGVAHGDVHSGNFLCRENKVFIIDFEYSVLNPGDEEINEDLELFNIWIRESAY